MCRHRIWLLNVLVVGAETSGRSDDQRLWALIFEVCRGRGLMIGRVAEIIGR